MFDKLNNLDVGKILFADLSYDLNGLFFKIHNQLGRYLNEKQYADALEDKLTEGRFNFEREKALPVSFKGEKTGRNIPDFIIEDKIIVDLKAKRIITKTDYFQMQRYLNSYRRELGIIVNFGQQYLSPKRILHRL